MILVSAIQREVAKHYRIPEGIMREPRPTGYTKANCLAHSRPRQAAIYLATRLTRHSYNRIGQLFGGRDHSTVLHAMHKTEQRLRTDPETEASMRAVARRLLLEDVA